MRGEESVGPLGGTAPSIGASTESEDPGDHNFWAAITIQALDVGIDSINAPYARVAPVLACAALPH
jgi:hypothetical protein